MAGGNLYDEARMRGLPDGGELVLGKRDLATPAALDVAFAKGIRVRYAHESGGVAAAPSGSGGCACNQPGCASCMWKRITSADGTYVVEVRGGRAVVHRLTPNGPVPLSDSK